jgi:hypothetical protein
VWIARVTGPTFSSPVPGASGTIWFAEVRVVIEARDGRVLNAQLERPTGSGLADIPLCGTGEVSTAPHPFATA